MDEIAQQDEAPTEATDETTDDTAADTGETTESVGDDQVSYGDLVDDDFGTALKIGALPLILLGVLFVVAAGIYFARRKNAWTDEELGVTASDRAAQSGNDFPTTADRSEMDETEPAKKL